ncbi:relaxase/mobilization nuclease domain-containing protein [Phenylobacterium sp. J426]|uniref:relaxase/mobilization nuclease domain-containing protein n=1 Tax=Phenylobacterium sp. J426 TaxID=2898439 RepID=UPI0035AFE193
MLSMPAQTDPEAFRDAARGFAADAFSGRFEYVFVLHRDTDHPHVHLTVRPFGSNGERLNPSKADVAVWRELLAEQLRERGIEAEATPRRARGVTRRREQGPLRRMGDRYEAGGGPVAETTRAAYLEAGLAAVRGDHVPRPWEISLLRRQQRIRALYLAQAEVLRASDAPGDRELGDAVKAWVRKMPQPESRRLAMARELRGAWERERREQQRTRERGRER